MAGFVDVIDALGGVRLQVTKAVPSPGNIVDAKHPTPEWFTVGLHELDGTDALAIVTEWNEFRSLDLARVKALLKSPVLIDLRNIYKPAEMRAMGFAYHSVGRLD